MLFPVGELLAMQTRAIFLAIAGSIALPLTSAFGQTANTAPQSVEERLRRLEQEVERLQIENQELKRELGLPQTSKIHVTAGGKEIDLKLGGFVQGQAEFGDRGDSRWGSENDRFFLRRARINTTATFAEHFDVKLELEVAGTLSETSGLRTSLTDGYINWKRFEAANIRFGQFKSPFGFEQLTSDTRLLTAERSLPGDRLTMGRQLGVEVSGQFLNKRLAYASGVFNGNGVNNNFNDNDSFMVVQRVSGVPWQGEVARRPAKWSVGANAFYSDDRSISGMGNFGFDATPATAAVDGVFEGIRRGVAADSQFNWGPFDLWAEYFRVQFDPENRIPAKRLDADGYYVQGSYYVWKKIVQGVIKYESFDPNIDLAGTSTDVWTFGLNYYIRDHDLKLQLNYLLFDANGQPDDRGKLLFRVQALF